MALERPHRTRRFPEGHRLAHVEDLGVEDLGFSSLLKCTSSIVKDWMTTCIDPTNTTLLIFDVYSLLLFVTFFPKDDNLGELMSTVCGCTCEGGQVWVHARGVAQARTPRKTVNTTIGRFYWLTRRDYLSDINRPRAARRPGPARRLPPSAEHAPTPAHPRTCTHTR